MATITYSIAPVSQALANSFYTTGPQANPTIAALAGGGGFISAWRDEAGTSGSLEGGAFTRAGALTAGTTRNYLNSTPSSSDSAPDVAGLANGNAVVVYQTSTGISFRILTPALTGVSSDTVIATSPTGKPFVAPVVTGLADGGFAVAWQYNYSSTDHDIYFGIYNADGSVRVAPKAVNASSSDDTDPQIAFVTGYNLIEVTWRRGAAGTVGTQIMTKSYTSSGGDGVPESAVYTESNGSGAASQPTSIGNGSGGYITSFVASLSTGSGTAYAVATYSTDSNGHTIFTDVVSSTSPLQDPSVAVLSNGLVALSYTVVGTSGAANFVQLRVFDPTQPAAQVPVLAQASLSGGIDQSDLVGLTDGRFVLVDRVTTGGATDIQERVFDLVRTTIGDGSSETLTGDSLSDVIQGGGGNDIIDGGGGIDTAAYSGPAASYLRVRNADGSLTVTDQRSGSPDGVDTLRNIELLQFSDGTISTNVATQLHDLTLDGRADLVWRGSDGSIRLWSMNGATIANDSLVTTIPNNWKIVGVGDVTGDGRADLVWESTAGEVRTWQMNGASITFDRQVATGIPAEWSVQKVADFNGDGRADLLWRSAASGEVRLWTLNASGQLAADQSVATVSGDWKIAGAGDFDGDGRADMLWRNDNGSNRIWLMNGASIALDTALGNGGASVPTSWKVEAVGDVNGDGKADIVWHNGATGEVRLWLMNGAAILNDVGLAPSGVGTAWSVQDLADFNGDGHADLMWRNADTGEVRLWTLSASGTIAADQRVALVGAEYHIVNSLAG